MLTLQQTGKLGRIPVILLGTDFWKPLDSLIKQMLVEKYETISPSDTNLYTITDNEDEILKIISESRLRDGQDALA
jgi:predicted Rossmann-fold nucleotide-binding protein